MNIKQIEIYKGLKTIGEEVASLYFDGVQICNLSGLKTSSYILAHIAREIDGGLRDIFANIDRDEKLDNEELKKIFEEIKTDYSIYKYLKDISWKKFKKNTGHIKSILTAFNLELGSEIAKQYIKVAIWFHKYAHRQGAHLAPREKEDMLLIWEEFEAVLSKIIGNYYAISDRLDVIINSDFPTEIKEQERIHVILNNILSHEARYVYFFKNLCNKTWLKPLYESRYFSGDKNPLPRESDESPGFYTVPYWTVFEFLLKISKNNFNDPDAETTGVLLKIIDEIFIYRLGEHRIVNFRTDHSLCQLIGLLPSDAINDNHFSIIKETLISGWENSLISSELDKLFMVRFIRERHTDFIIKLLDIVLSYVETNGFGSDKVTSLMTDYWFEQLLSTRKEEFLSICPLEVYKLITDRIREICDKYKYIFDNITTPAIEEHHQNVFPERYTSQVTFLLRDCLLQIPDEEIKTIVKKLLNSRIPVLKRVAIHTIKSKYYLLSDLFWKWKENPLIGTFDGQYKHELYELFKNHANEFNEDQVGKILGWIEEKEYYVSSGADEELTKKIIAHQKKEWLSSVLSNNDERIIPQYEVYNSINNSELSHPGFEVWHGEVIVGYTSPLTHEQIDSFSLAELIDYFEDYRSKPQSFSGPSVEGLSEIIVSEIRNKPEKYCDAGLIVKSSHQFQYSWMCGLREADAEKNFDLECVMQASEIIFKEDGFWEINNKTESENYPNLYLSEFLRLVESGIGKDHKSLVGDNLQRIKSLLITVLEKDEKIPFDFDELSMKALNNSKGELYNALFQYLLKFNRENKDKERLYIEVDEVVGLLLANNVSEDLLYFSFGRFLPYINAVHPDWMNANIDNFFNKCDIPKFNATACGYFFYNASFYLNEFKLLYEKGIYEKALDYDFSQEERGAIDNLVHHVMVALVEDLISIDDVLIDKLIQSKIEQYQSNLIYKFWSPNRTLTEKEKQKVVPLFIKIISVELEKDKPEQNENLKSGLSKWFNSMDKIEDEVYKIQLKVTDVIKSSDKYSYLEGLQKHMDAQTEIVGNLLVGLFEHRVEYDISRGMITKLTEKLYHLGFKSIADKICLLHGERGIDILKELYKRNQN